MSKYELNQGLAVLAFLAAYSLAIVVEPMLPDIYLGFPAALGVAIVLVLSWLIQRRVK